MELGKQSAHARLGDAISPGMGEDRLAAGRADPSDRLRERCPGVRHVPGLALNEIAIEDVLDLVDMACLDEKAREMGTRDEALAGDVPHRALVRAANAGFG